MNNLPTTTEQHSLISQNIYITGTDRNSGKSIIMLAIMEMLTGYAGKVGFFRPIIHSGDHQDDLIQFITHRYQPDIPYEAMYGCKSSHAHELVANQHYDDLLKIILGKYRALKSQCDLILCIGSDYRNGDSIFEFDFNAEVANNLDCQIMPVMHGADQDNIQILNNLAVNNQKITGGNKWSKSNIVDTQKRPI